MLEASLTTFFTQKLAVVTGGRIVIGFSGGLDSSVLLHVLARSATTLNIPMVALHVHHGLSKNADQWAAHAIQFCQVRGIDCQIVYATVKNRASIEAAAREARHQAFASFLKKNDCLCLAQHRGDQAETVLLRLLRGSGVKGLSAMQEEGRFCLADDGDIPLYRPLLGYSRQALYDYAQQQGLTWVEDESNTNEQFDRNFLRHRVLPLLQSRWRGSESVLAATAKRMQEAENLLQEMSQNFARQLMDLKGNLSQSGLAELAMEVNGLAKQRLVLRYWIQQHHHVLPDENVLECLRLMMTTANTDKQPCIAWSNVEVRVFQGWLTILRQRPPIDSSWQAEWDGKSPLLLPDGSRLVVIADAEENGLKLRVSYRQGGERIFRHGQHQLLKKLMQSEFIPPWQRDVLPLIWRDNQLIAVGGTKLSCDSNRLRFELEKA